MFCQPCRMFSRSGDNGAGGASVPESRTSTCSAGAELERGATGDLALRAASLTGHLYEGDECPSPLQRTHFRLIPSSLLMASTHMDVKCGRAQTPHAGSEAMQTEAVCPNFWHRLHCMSLTLGLGFFLLLRFLLILMAPSFRSPCSGPSCLRVTKSCAAATDPGLAVRMSRKARASWVASSSMLATCVTFGGQIEYVNTTQGLFPFIP